MPEINNSGALQQGRTPARRIARRFVLYIVLLSSLITLITTAAQLFFDYKRDINAIESQIELIRKSNLESIVNSVWVEDVEQINNQLNGLVRHKDLELLSISINGELQWLAGERLSKRIVTKNIPLTYHYRNKEVVIGELSIIASIDSILSRLYDKTVVILISNGLKTFIVAAFIILLFNFLVGRHLYRLAEWAGSFDLNKKLTPIKLDREVHDSPKAIDEFDMVVGSLNEMQQSVQQVYSSLERQALRDQETLNLHLEKTPLAALTWDKDFKCTEWNRSAERIFGYTHAEAIGKHALDLIVPSILSGDIQEIFHDLLNQKGGSHNINENVTKNGDTILCEWFNTPIKSEDGTPIAVASLAQDITIQQQYKTDLIAAKDEAEQANKSKSEFLSSMSHELRTPLNAILGFGQLLEMVQEEPVQKKNAGEIIKAGKHLLELINDILDLSRIEAGKLDMSIEDISLNGIVEECLELIRPMADAHGIKLIDQISPHSEFIIHVDYTRCKQVLLNLISNAIKYNNPQGSVTLSCDYVEDHMLRVNVIDTGSGLSEEQQHRLFRPFERIEGNDGIEGTGIGLVITRRLVEMMGGMVGVISEPGSGSCFWFEFAIGQNGNAAMHGNEHSTSDISSVDKANRKTVLYIEDNPANLRLVEQIIEKHSSYKCITSQDASTGLALAESHQPELILMDINLPGMDGYEATQRLQANPLTQHIPVVALSANAMPKDMEKGYQIGFQAYLTKPINVQDLLGELDKRLKD